MADLDLTTQRVVLTKISTPLKPGAIVKPQVLLTSLLSALGFSSVIIGATAPGDQEALWYNKDTNTFRRYNPLTSTWAVMVPAQWVMHLFQMGMKAATVEGIVDSADKHLFFDVSANEIKTISDADYKLSLGLSGWMQYGPTVTLGANSPSVEFTLPAIYRDFALRATFTTTGGSVTYGPRVKGVYASLATVDLTNNQNTYASSPQTRVYSGDRSDLTGFMQCLINGFGPGDPSTSASANMPYFIPVTDRVTKIRFHRPDGTGNLAAVTEPWQFAAGSVFKLFVR